MSSFADSMVVDPYGGLDDDNARAILEVQIADLAEAESAVQYQAGTSEDQDAQLSASLLRQNLEALRDSISDRRMACSIATAVIFDGSRVSAHAREEEIARRDNEMAQQLQTGRQPPATSPAPNSIDVDDASLSKMTGLFVDEDMGLAIMPVTTLEAETIRPTGNWGPRPKLHDCVICGDQKSFFEILKAPCGDEYCRDCLRELFETSYTDESLFPPRCCRQIIPIDSKDIALFLSKNLRDQYEARRVEVETKDRKYCSNLACAAFIPPNEIADKVAVCPTCTTRTCSGCKRVAHSGICAEDPEDQAVLEVALQEGWQKCSSCNHLVELNHGCNHITSVESTIEARPFANRWHRCRCNAEFCYCCGKTWKTCECEQWHEDRLLIRAERIVDRENVAVPANREQQVQEMMQVLRERHECDHRGYWERIPGPHECENCNQNLPSFILRCPHCHVQMCRRCKKNRL